jgi:hypothetical protein
MLQHPFDALAHPAQETHATQHIKNQYMHTAAVHGRASTHWEDVEAMARHNTCILGNQQEG